MCAVGLLCPESLGMTCRAHGVPEGQAGEAWEEDRERPGQVGAVQGSRKHE